MGLHKFLSVFFLSLFFATNASAADPIRIVAFGDSLTAGYNLDRADGFVPRLEAALRKKGHDVVVVNAGVSGDTTSGGLARLDWSIGSDADAVIVELGANDMLRAIAPEQIGKNLDAIARRLKERGLPALISGMLAAPNLGEDYQQAFDPLFGQVAERYNMVFYPFFLDGVAGQADYNLADGIHPNKAGVEVIVENILPFVEELIGRVKAQSS